MLTETTKIAIVGAGPPGAAIAAKLAGPDRELVLFDHDLTNAARGSSIVVVAAGHWLCSATPDMDELLEWNAPEVRRICEQIRDQAPKATVLVATYPVELVAHIAHEVTGFPGERIVGAGGVRDTGLFARMIRDRLGSTSADLMGAVVLGSQGKGTVPIVSHCTVGGHPLTRFLSKREIRGLVALTKASACMIDADPYYDARAAAVGRIVEEVILAREVVLPCTVLSDGSYMTREGVFISLPVTLSLEGAAIVPPVLTLSTRELKELRAASNSVYEQVPTLSRFLR